MARRELVEEKAEKRERERVLANENASRSSSIYFQLNTSFLF